jgi:hypothetical protein
MSRRQFLKQTATALPVVSAGCLRTSSDAGSEIDGGCTGEWTPTVDAGEPTLSPGAETILHIEVADIRGLQLRLPIHTDDDPLQFPEGVATPSPPPDRQADVSPPKWYWTDCTAVEIDVPLHVSPDAQPTTIEYTVHLVQSLDGSGESIDETFTITVSNE